MSVVWVDGNCSGYREVREVLCFGEEIGRGGCGVAVKMLEAIIVAVAFVVKVWMSAVVGIFRRRVEWFW